MNEKQPNVVIRIVKNFLDMSLWLQLVIVAVILAVGWFTGCVPNLVKTVQGTGLLPPTVSNIGKQPVAVSPTTQSAAAGPANPTLVLGQPSPTAARAASPTPGAPTIAAVAPLQIQSCPNAKYKIELRGTLEYAPYQLWILAALTTACKYDVYMRVIDDTGDEEWQADILAGKAPKDFVTPLPAERINEAKFQPPAPGVERILLSTTSSCTNNAGCKIFHFLGQSSGNDLIIVRPQVGTVRVDTFDQILDNPIVATTFGSVGQTFINILAWSLVERPIGEFRPLGDVGPAVKYFCAHSEIPSLVAYVPDASDALDPGKCNGTRGTRAFSTSKTFVGIWDMAAKKDGPRSEGIYRALKAYAETLTFVTKEPQRSWETLDAWANQSTENRSALYYTDYGTWLLNLDGEAMANGPDNVYLFGIGRPATIQRLKDIQDIYRNPKYATFRRNGGPVYPPDVPAESLLDATYVSELRSDQIFMVNVTTSNHALSMDMFAPETTGRKVLSTLPYLTAAKFVGASTLFEDAALAQEQFAKVTRALRYLKVNFDIQINGDDLSQARAGRVQQELRVNRVPDKKVTVTRVPNLPAGWIQFALVGNEE